jgi:prepilin-type N-terminal cleavage/methylation domain-containing protein
MSATSCSCSGRGLRCRAFTLIELLTVIAIIALLMSILLPALGQARDQAKVVKTKGAMAGMGAGLELFRTENEAECRGGYPPSTLADDATQSGKEAFTDSIYGAQWLVRYLMGKDLRGYVPLRNVPKNCWGTDGWEQKGWYDNPGDNDFPANAKTPFSRVGPYLNAEGVKTRLTKDITGCNSTYAGGNTGNNPVFIDSFEMPIVYYAADATQSSKSDASIATTELPQPPDNKIGYRGIYNFGDNVLFTGGCTCVLGTCSCLDPWDYGGGIGPLAFTKDYEQTPPKNAGGRVDWAGAIETGKVASTDFPAYILNRSVYEASRPKANETPRSAVPQNKDKFLLISPGKDGQFGTSDDICNFDRQ